MQNIGGSKSLRDIKGLRRRLSTEQVYIEEFHFDEENKGTLIANDQPHFYHGVIELTCNSS